MKIRDKEIALKYSFRSLMLYENIQNKTFAPQTMTDILVFFYCVIVASDRDIQLSFDAFLDEIDARPELLSEFSEWLTAEMTKNDMLEAKQDDNEGKKK